MSVVTALLLTAAPVHAPIGLFDGWGAFADTTPPRCYAVAQPVRAGGTGAFASISTWPGRGLRNQLYLRLGRAPAAQARVTLSIGDRRFELVARDREAWAPDSRADAAIVAAMRSGRSMSVETVRAGGAPVADIYALRGAATAIDAASLACLGR